MNQFSELPKRARRAEDTPVVGRIAPTRERSKFAAETRAETRPAFGRAEAADSAERLFEDAAAELDKALSAELNLDLDATLAQIKEAAARVDQSPKAIEAAEAACAATAFDQLFKPAETPGRKTFLTGVKSLDHLTLGDGLATAEHSELTNRQKDAEPTAFQIKPWAVPAESRDHTIVKPADLGRARLRGIPLMPQRVEITDETPRIRRQGPGGPFKTIGGK